MRKRIKCKDCGKIIESYSEAAQPCSAPANKKNGWPHTVSASTYFDMEEKGEQSGRTPQERTEDLNRRRD